MKLLVMGAGYVGIALLQQLQQLHYTVVVTTTQADKVESLQQYAGEVILLSSGDDTPLQKAIRECDAMIVLIAPKNKASYEDTYLKMAKKIAGILHDRKSPFYLLYTSSTSVYEGIREEWATEELELTPPSENGKILLEAEKWILKHPNSCVLRLGGIFGPQRELSKRALHFSGKEFPGAGDVPTNHIHRDDIVCGILYCLKEQLKGIYNLVNDDHPTRKGLYSRLCKEQSVVPPLWSDNPQQRGYKVCNKKIPFKPTKTVFDR